MTKSLVMCVLQKSQENAADQSSLEGQICRNCRNSVNGNSAILVYSNTRCFIKNLVRWCQIFEVLQLQPQKHALKQSN